MNKGQLVGILTAAAISLLSGGILTAFAYAGEHCRFCKSKAVCRKRAEYNLELVKYDFEMPATLEDDEIAAILIKADELAAWAADVKEFALQQALSGVKYDGFKIVEGRSNRKYTDENAVADTVKKQATTHTSRSSSVLLLWKNCSAKRSLQTF